MRNQTFGVEIEMNNISRNHAAQVAANFFGTGRYKYTGTAYDTWTAYDQRGRAWKFMSDASIAGPRTQACECVTPILHYDDMDTLQELVRQLRHAGAKSDYTRNCGIHVHIGAEGHTPQTLRNLVNIMASHETLLADSIRIGANRSNYCKPVDPRFLKELNEKKPETMTALADVWYQSQGWNFNRNAHYNNSRYHMLNLHATFTKGTIEFRMFQFDRPASNHRSGLHAGKIKAYVQFCLAISDFAKRVKKASPKVVQSENQKFAMRTWMNRMGMIGDEFATAREVFMKNLTGDSAFRFGRPAA